MRAPPGCPSDPLLRICRDQPHQNTRFPHISHQHLIIQLHSRPISNNHRENTPPHQKDEGVLVINKTQTYWRCDPECEHYYKKPFVADDWVLQVTSSSAVVPYEVIWLLQLVLCLYSMCIIISTWLVYFYWILNEFQYICAIINMLYEIITRIIFSREYWVRWYDINT